MYFVRICWVLEADLTSVDCVLDLLKKMGPLPLEC